MKPIDVKRIVESFLSSEVDLLRDSKKRRYRKGSQSSSTNLFSGKEAHLIWQYVRFNESYQTDYGRMRRVLSNDSLSDETIFLKETAFKAKWNLSEVRDPNENAYAPDFYFSKQYVWPIAMSKKMSKPYLELVSNLNSLEHSALNTKELLIVVRPGPHDKVLDQIRRLLKNDVAEWNDYFRKKKSHSAVNKNLVNNLCAYLLVTKCALKGKALEEKYAEVMRLKTRTRSDQIRQQVVQFVELSSSAPDVFLLGYKNNN